MRRPYTATRPSTSISTADAFWRNIPATVWTYNLGGYQVLKKWLSYREHDVSLGRAADASTKSNTLLTRPGELVGEILGTTASK